MKSLSSVSDVDVFISKTCVNEKKQRYNKNEPLIDWTWVNPYSLNLVNAWILEQHCQSSFVLCHHQRFPRKLNELGVLEDSDLSDIKSLRALSIAIILIVPVMKHSSASCLNMLSLKHLTIINGLDINFSHGLFSRKLCSKFIFKVFHNWMRWGHLNIKWNLVWMGIMICVYHLIFIFIFCR